MLLVSILLLCDCGYMCGKVHIIIAEGGGGGGGEGIGVSNCSSGILNNN